MAAAIDGGSCRIENGFSYRTTVEDRDGVKVLSPLIVSCFIFLEFYIDTRDHEEQAR